MACILYIESSTLTCSVAISRNGKLFSLKESHDASYAHSEKLVVYVDHAIKEAGLQSAEINAVCVSKGPGSYTGLRIGVSAAKGLCFGLDIPLISIGSLHSMASWARTNYSEVLTDDVLLCPMIDARRMEVYTQVFDASLNQVQPVSAKIIDNESFASILKENKVAFFGDGATKCKEVINHPNSIFLDGFNPSAQGMIALAEMKLKKGHFEDLAYFEPYYLKDFVAGKPKTMFK